MNSAKYLHVLTLDPQSRLGYYSPMTEKETEALGVWGACSKFRARI